MRVSASSLFGLPATAPKPDTIYYLKTETPHLNDFSMFGPFHCLEAVVPSIRGKLRNESPLGLDMFNEMMSSKPDALSGFEHIVAPLSGNNTLVIRLCKELNAEVAASLPGPVWVVFCGEVSGDGTMTCIVRAAAGAKTWMVESKFESGVEIFE